MNNMTRAARINARQDRMYARIDNLRLAAHLAAEAHCHDGVYYFPSTEAAATFARCTDNPTDRIIQYARGYAIQNGISGSYVGPNNLHPKAYGEPAL